MKTHHSIRLGSATDLHFIEDSSVDLVVTSPPYFGQRIYFDDEGNEIVEAVGSEATPEEYLKALDLFMDEMWRVIKPTGSVFVNLGDKYAGSGGHNNDRLQGTKYDPETITRNAPNRYAKVDNIRRKSLMGLPWRFALNAMDAGWVLRQEIIWSKPNGMPESVTDRTRRVHEQWFHFTKEEKYYAVMDELREPHTDETIKRTKRGRSDDWGIGRHPPDQPRQNWQPEKAAHKLGSLPASVQSISTGGVRPTKSDVETFNLPDHFAPFPAEWPRFIILGWSPRAWCGECGEAVVPVVERKVDEAISDSLIELESARQRTRQAVSGGKTGSTLKQSDKIERNILGYSCPCESPPSSWAPSLVLDPFGGTGTTSLVARILERSSISVDISPAYVRLMKWRVFVSAHAAKIEAKWRKKGLLPSYLD